MKLGPGLWYLLRRSLRARRFDTPSGSRMPRSNLTVSLWTTSPSWRHLKCIIRYPSIWPEVSSCWLMKVATSSISLKCFLRYSRFLLRMFWRVLRQITIPSWWLKTSKISLLKTKVEVHSYYPADIHASWFLSMTDRFVGHARKSETYGN